METTTIAEKKRAPFSQFADLFQAIEDGDNLRAVLQSALDKAIEFTGAECGVAAVRGRTVADEFVYFFSGSNAQEYAPKDITAPGSAFENMYAHLDTVVVNDITEPSNTDYARHFSSSPRNFVALPVRYKDELIGIVFIFNKIGAERFYDSDINELTFFSNTISVILDNQLVRQIAEADIYRLKTLQKTSQIINSQSSINELLLYIMEAAKSVFRAEGSSLLLIDHERKELVFDLVSGGSGEKIKAIRIPFGQGIAGQCAQTGESYLINDAANDPRIYKRTDRETNFITRNMLCVPMRAHGNIIGVLQVVNRRDDKDFLPGDLELFEALADNAGIAIHNRGLMQNLEESNRSLARRVLELNVMYETSQALADSFDIDATYPFVAATIAEKLEVRRVSIMLYDHQEENLLMRACSGISLDIIKSIKVKPYGGIIGAVMKSGDPLFIEDIAAHHELGRYKKFRYTTPSFIIVPLTYQEKTVGVFCIADKNDGDAFTEEDFKLLQMVGEQISSAYERWVLNNEFLEKQRIQHDLDITKDIQQSVLPKHFPENNFFEVAATAIPAKEVGGDFYDMIPINSTSFGFFMADVSGKSIPAALFMAFARSIMRIQTKIYHTPAAVLNEANTFLTEDSKRGMFVTLFYMFIEPLKFAMRYGCAGHNAQLYYNSVARSCEWLKAKGRPLGLIEASEFEETKMRVNSGDVIILCTDGVFEALNENNEEYGEDRLVEAVKGAATKSADEILNAIIESIRIFVGEASQHDDLTLMIIKVK